LLLTNWSRLPSEFYAKLEETLEGFGFAAKARGVVRSGL
jgi:hypothetical protein